MVKVTLYNQSKDQTIELANSTVTTVGRGFFACQDKRVSRHHGELTVIDSKLKVKACHINPIFFKKSDEVQKQILAKNAEILLANKDKFSLLPNEFEYEIKVVEDQQVVGDNNHVNMEEALDDENNRDMNRSPSPNGLETAQISLETSINNQAGPSERAGNRKRSIDDVEGDEENAKRPKPSSSDDLPKINNAEKSPLAVNNEREEHVNGQQDIAMPQPEENYVTTASHDDGIKIKPDPDCTNMDTSASTSSHDYLVKIKPDPDSTNAEIKAPVSCPENIQIKPDPDSKNSETTSPDNIIKIKSDPDGPTAAPSSGEPVAKAETSGVKTETVNSSTNKTPISNVPSNLRSSCEFGIGCYRLTADHRRDIAHPFNADYRRPDFPAAAADLPNCPFWESCYRRNPEHFRLFQHPPSNVYSTQPVAPPPLPQLPGIQNVRAVPQHDSDEEDISDEDLDDSEVDEDFQIDEGEDDGISSGSDHDDEDENNLEE